MEPGIMQADLDGRPRRPGKDVMPSRPVDEFEPADADSPGKQSSEQHRDKTLPPKKGRNYQPLRSCKTSITAV
jgi:hypothetical protein